MRRKYYEESFSLGEQASDMVGKYEIMGLTFTLTATIIPTEQLHHTNSSRSYINDISSYTSSSSNFSISSG
jgi:hypothetical protein